jgi:hypothetical protein
MDTDDDDDDNDVVGYPADLIHLPRWQDICRHLSCIAGLRMTIEASPASTDVCILLPASSWPPAEVIIGNTKCTADHDHTNIEMLG